MNRKTEMTYERKCLDIFTGLGCFSVAARACGVRTVAMCERDQPLRHFLAANWPGVEIHDDAKTLDATRYRGVWLVCGGPPCQPSSLAGKRRGAKDPRWLWGHALRIVAESQPAWVLFENPLGFAGVGLDGVLAELEAQDYETGTLNIPACGVNAPHRRERLWIVGNRVRERCDPRGPSGSHGERPEGGCGSENAGVARALGHAKDHTGRLPGGEGRGEDSEPGGPLEIGALANPKSISSGSGLCDQGPSGLGRGIASDEDFSGDVADASCEPTGAGRPKRSEARRQDSNTDPSSPLADSLRGELAQRQSEPRDVRIEQPAAARSPGFGLWDEYEWIECGDGKRRRAKPGVHGLVDGPPVGLLEALGNAVVWTIPARIIAAMIQAEDNQ